MALGGGGAIENVQEKHCCSVTLIVVGEDLDPDIVTEALGLPAHQSWRRGERKSFARRDGSVRYFDSIHEVGGWKHFLPDPYRENRPLHEQFDLWLARLRANAEAIRALKARGWEVELDCYYAAGSDVLVLGNSELRELAELGVGLALTLAACSEPADA
ncbi:MAG: DUF4279 domain-containing protein [Isosphaeraceae bacterium]